MDWNVSSCNESFGFLGLVSPCWWESLGASVVSCKSVNSGLDQDESELSVSVGSVLLDMLSNVNSLLDQVVEILWQGGSDSIDLEDSKNLRSGDSFNLRNTVLISKENTDLGWG